MFRRTAAVAGFALIAGIGMGIQPASASATSPPQVRPNQKTYVRDADGICQDATDRIDAVVEDLGFTPTDREARRAARRVVRISRHEVRELRQLQLPKGDAREVSQIYDAVDTALNRVEAKPHRLFDEPGPFERPARLAKAYGFDVCGRG
jgi:hypothetical protein